MAPLINRCLAVEDVRCNEVPDDDQVLCPRHFALKDTNEANFSIAIVPLEEFNKVLV